MPRVWWYRCRVFLHEHRRGDELVFPVPSLQAPVEGSSVALCIAFPSDIVSCTPTMLHTIFARRAEICTTFVVYQPMIIKYP